MFFKKLRKSLFTLDTLEYWGIAATLIYANYWSFQDEDDHVHMTRILATGHTLFTFVKNLSNLKKAYIEPEDRIALWGSTGLFNAGAAGTLLSVWLTDDPLLNFVSGVSNASCNFLSKFVTHSYKRIRDDLTFPTGESLGSEDNSSNPADITDPSDTADAGTSPYHPARF